jgi:hypothetical protein
MRTHPQHPTHAHTHTRTHAHTHTHTSPAGHRPRRAQSWRQGGTAPACGGCRSPCCRHSPSSTACVRVCVCGSVRPSLRAAPLPLPLPGEARQVCAAAGRVRASVRCAGAAQLPRRQQQLPRLLLPPSAPAVHRCHAHPSPAGVARDLAGAGATAALLPGGAGARAHRVNRSAVVMGAPLGGMSTRLRALLACKAAACWICETRCCVARARNGVWAWQRDRQQEWGMWAAMHTSARLEGATRRHACDATHTRRFGCYKESPKPSSAAHVCVRRAHPPCHCPCCPAPGACCIPVLCCI